ncbi:MAG: hypothetical protein MJZ68_01410 [archaeon]|nr:hypothetical protein [archaeon]
MQSDLRMYFPIDVSLDPTLGCGQAHRWRKLEDGSWQGVIKDHVVTLIQKEQGFECTGDCASTDIYDYFRAEDDLDSIIEEISEADPYVKTLSEKCPGMRILKQPEWECLATYVLAANVNLKRIAKMVESVCDHYGTDLGERRAFPTPEQILKGKDTICECRLGFREQRFIELAQRVHDGEVDIEGMRSLTYSELIEALMDIKGVGPKIADCVALFGYGHLEAFPVDIRIQHVVKERYGVEGSYKTVSTFGRERFGRYAGYAQEFLYHSDFI